jgi:hemoglobin/transferrin/lactoferrin receptor protein
MRREKGKRGKRGNVGLIFTFCFFAFFTFWGTVGATAQIGGQIHGQITDQSGAAVPGATIILFNIATATETLSVTDADGRYEFNGVSIGIYRLRVRKTGFSETGRNVELAEPGEILEVNFDLSAGGISEQITVTAIRGERDVLDVPIRTQTLDENVLTRQNPAGTGDALLNVPNLTPQGSGPYLTRPRLRGFDSTRLLVLVDGERLNNSRTSTGAAGVEVGLVDPSLIDAVEVVHGAGSALYGTDALSGLVNIITQMPQTVAERWRVGGSFTGYVSSNEPGRRGTARLDVSGRRFAARVSGMLERFPSYHAGEPFNESNIPLIEAGIVPHLQFGPIPDNFNEPFVRASSEIPNSQEHGNSLNVVGRYFISGQQSVKVNWIRRRAVDIGFPDFAPPYFFQVIKLPGSDLDKASLRYEAAALTPWFSRLAVGGYWQHQNRRLFNDFFVLSLSPSEVTPALDELTRVDIVSNTGQNVKSFGYDVQANFLLGTKNLLTAGSSLFRDHSKDARQIVVDVTTIGALTRPPRAPRFFPLNNPIVVGAVSFEQRVPISNFRNFAIFLQDEQELTPAIRLIGSLRIDRFDIDSQETPNYNPRPPDLADADPPVDLSTVPPPSGITFNRSSVTGDFGVVYRALPALSVTARVGRSFRHPNLSELFFSGPAESGTLVPNIALEPETGINVDVGAKLRTNRLEGSLTFFHNWYKNFLSREIVSVSRMAGGAVYQAVNFSRVRIRGVEANWEVPLQAPHSYFSFFGDFSYLWGEIAEGQNPLTQTRLENAPANNITPYKIVAGLCWNDYPNRFWWEYAIRAQTHVDRISPLLLQSPLLQAPDLWNLNGFTLHSLRGGYNFVRGERTRVSVTLGLENLGNKFYREQFQYAPARGRSFTVGLNLKYF